MNSYNLITLFISFSLPFFIILILLKKKGNSDHAKRLPPGPKKLPIIGNLHQLGKLPQRSLQRLSNEYGGLMFLQLGSVPTLVISSAEIAKEIFKTHDLVFSSRPALQVAKKLSHNCSSVSFAPYGDLWREHRKILILELLSAKRVESFQAIRDEEVSLMINCILKHSAGAGRATPFTTERVDPPLNQPINISEVALSLSNKIACRVAFGQRTDNSEGKFIEILQETQDLLGTVNIADIFPRLAWLNKFNGFEARLEKNFSQMDAFFDEVIDDHLDPKRPKVEHEDVVDVMLRLQKEYPNQSITSKNEHIKGVLADIFIAGSDTSSATVVWTMAELIKNPRVLEKAQREVSHEVVKKKGKVEESDLSKLVYLKMVVKESLRLHPPVPLLLPRETLENCRVQGYEIAEKTRVLINAAAISTDPKCWRNPYEFQPERFLDNSIDFRGQNFEFIPFGTGRRGCPGINFALPLIELALANLLCCFDWTLPKGMLAKDVDMEEAVGLTTHKKTPLYLVPCPKLL